MRYFLKPFFCFLFLAGCNATVNGPFLNKVKKERQEIETLNDAADQLFQSDRLQGEARFELRFAQRKVQSEMHAISQIADLTREHIQSPWWTDWFFPFDGWGETSFYVGDSALKLHKLLQMDIVSFKALIAKEAGQTGLADFLPKAEKSHLKAHETISSEEEAALLKQAKAKSEGKVTDPFKPEPKKLPETAAPEALPDLPSFQPELAQFLSGQAAETDEMAIESSIAPPKQLSEND